MCVSQGTEGEAGQRSGQGWQWQGRARGSEIGVCSLQGHSSSCGTAQDKLCWAWPRALAGLAVPRRSQVLVPWGTAGSVPPRALRRHLVLRHWGLLAQPQQGWALSPLVLPSASPHIPVASGICWDQSLGSLGQEWPWGLLHAPRDCRFFQGLWVLLLPWSL